MERKPGQARNPLYEGAWYSFRDYCLHTYGEKCYKLPLDIGCTCPNRDGTLGVGGCSFCGAAGAGEFAGDRRMSVSWQLAAGKETARVIRPRIRRYIAYFQAFSNTYAPVSYLRECYFEAAADPDVAAVCIATRPDCFSPEIYALLSELAERCPVTVELGLQTIREETAKAFGRGYAYPVFLEAVERLHALDIPVTVHLIAGLPGEAKEDFLASVTEISRLPVTSVKFHLLYLLSGTRLAAQMDPAELLSEDAYIDWICDGLAALRPDICVQRLTGDPPKDLLIGPAWCTDKPRILNRIRHECKLRNIVQGCRFVPEQPEERIPHGTGYIDFI